MDSISYIKNGIKKLYENAPDIHINVNLSRPKIIIEASPAKIVGVHKHIFQIEENENGRPVRHTFQYGDVLIGHITIKELDFIPLTEIKESKG